MSRTAHSGCYNTDGAGRPGHHRGSQGALTSPLLLTLFYAYRRRGASETWRHARDCIMLASARRHQQKKRASLTTTARRTPARHSSTAAQDLQYDYRFVRIDAAAHAAYL